MKLHKLAGLGIASFVLFGSLGELAINPKSAQALQPTEATTFTVSNKSLKRKAKLLKIKRHGRRGLRNHRRRSFRRHHGRRGFRKNFNHGFIKNSRLNHRNHVHFDNTFSTGNNFHERFGRVRLF